MADKDHSIPEDANREDPGHDGHPDGPHEQTGHEQAGQ